MKTIQDQIKDLGGNFHSWNVLDEFYQIHQFGDLLGLDFRQVCDMVGIRHSMGLMYIKKLKRYNIILPRLEAEKCSNGSNSNLRTSAIQVDSLNDILGNIDSQDNSQNNLQFNTKTKTKKRTPIKSDLSVNKIAELNALLD